MTYFDGARTWEDEERYREWEDEQRDPLPAAPPSLALVSSRPCKDCGTPLTMQRNFAMCLCDGCEAAWHERTYTWAIVPTED